MTAGTSTPCEVCSGERFTVRYPVTDTNQDVPGTWHIVSCDRCGLGRLDPMPLTNAVATFYRDTFYADGGHRFRPWMEALRRWLATARGHHLRRLMPRGGRLLDFGAGTGHFAASLRTYGWDASSVDPYSTAADVTADVHGEAGLVRLDCPDGYWDAITLWYVFEHLLHPRLALREFHRALRPGGVLVLAQQDFSSVQARYFGRCWLFLDPPRHLFQFDPTNLRWLAEQEGFTVCHVEMASIEMGPFTILQSLLNCIVGNQNYLFRFLKNRHLGGQRWHGTAGRCRASVALVVSGLLTPVLAPLALAAYFVLLGMGSGDVFTVYLERRSS